MHQLTVKAAKKAVTPINHFEDLNLRKHGGRLESLHEGRSFCPEANISSLRSHNKCGTAHDIERAEIIHRRVEMTTVNTNVSCIRFFGGDFFCWFLYFESQV